ncbi:MAG: methionyl-tRNA formyltransferase [Thermoleophilaceae bacterium]|nr:methionyl-tRNA formyltransferase [Thermoleophilaceae bacterium]
MRTVYLGTSDFAATVLERLAASDHRPLAVVTRPARPKGRGKQLTHPPVADLARTLELELLQPENVNDEAVVAQIAALKPDALVVCAYGAIVKEPLLSLAPIFNVHPSLLPRWRGAAPLERAIAAGDPTTGVSIMSLVEELDAGPVCAVVEEPIGPEDDYGTLAARLSQVGSELLVEALDKAQRGEIVWTEQHPTDAVPVTYAEKITRDDRLLNATSATAVELEAMVRALTPHIGAMFELADGQMLRVEKARVVGDGVPAGKSAAIDGHLLVGTQSGSLELLQVKPAGGKSMDAASYVRGHGEPEFR